MTQKFLAFTVAAVEPIALGAVVDPGLLEIANRGAFNHCAACGVAPIPHSINIVMFSQNFRQRVAFASHDINDPIRNVARVQHLIQIGGGKWVCGGWNQHYRVAQADRGSQQRDRAQQGIFGRANQRQCAKRLNHRQCCIPNRRGMHSPIVFIRPSCIGKQTFNRQFNLGVGIGTVSLGGDASGKFGSADAQIFRQVIQNLGAVVRGLAAPTTRRPCRFDRIANILAVAVGDFAQQRAIVGINRSTHAAIRPRLLATDIHFWGAVNGREEARR